MSSINDNPTDLLTGVDMTGLPAAAGSDVNNAIDFAVPLKTAADETVGRALILTTIDSALNTPDVPNPALNANYTKFKRYQWNRRPFAGAAIKGFQVYQWNDDAPADAILLKWVAQFFDTTGISAVANNALATANNAVAIANNASSLAVTANTTATNANNAVAGAVLTATNAQTTANAAQTAATAAQTTATNAQNSANLALAQGMRLQNFAIFYEAQPKGTDAGASLLGKNTRILNTTGASGTSINAIIAAPGIISVGNGGWYWIEAESTIYDTVANFHQLFLVDNATNNNLLEGLSTTHSGGNISSKSRVCGIVQLVNAQSIRLDHYTSHALAANGLGKAANVNPNAGGNEIYTTLTLAKLGIN